MITSSLAFNRPSSKLSLHIFHSPSASLPLLAFVYRCDDLQEIWAGDHILRLLQNFCVVRSKEEALWSCFVVFVHSEHAIRGIVP